MPKQSVESGELIHSTNERVKELEIVIKGSVIANSGDTVIDLPYGSVLGLLETPGELYRFDYEAKDDAVIVSYPYKSGDSLRAIIKANPQITPLIAGAAIMNVHSTFEKTAQLIEACRSLSERVGSSEEKKYDLKVWKFDFFRALSKLFPSKDIALCTGVILSAFEYLQYLALMIPELIEKKSEYDLSIDSEMEIMEDMAEEDAESLAEEEASEEAAAGEEEAPEEEEAVSPAPAGGEGMPNAMEDILAYAGVDEAKCEKFRKLIETFTATSDRSATTDDVRLLRRQITEQFYDIYEKALFRSFRDRNVPLVMKMFFYFGFVDEKLAGAENTRCLMRLAQSYEPDPLGNVVTAYEWLRMIFNKKVEPSKNEFDMEYPKFMKQQLNDGEIKQDEYKRLIDDQEEKVRFELRNFIRNGSKVTFGRITSFVPVFTNESVMKEPEKAMATAKAIHEALDMVRNIDFSCFCRQMIYTNPSAGINREFIDTEILPYIILMPNGGSRVALWQEISGAKHDTPGRMMMPLFPEKEVTGYILKLCGEFRWEMCRRDQGVHWNDVTVPSLTSLFCDYLQFYRKNHDLSPELREKIKTQLQAARNQSKVVFVSDYMDYISFESKGALRLNKASREIIFKFCPFKKEIREKLMASSPAYQKLIEIYEIKQSQKLHLMDILYTKIEKAGAAVPSEIAGQREFLQT